MENLAKVVRVGSTEYQVVIYTNAKGETFPAIKWEGFHGRTSFIRRDALLALAQAEAVNASMEELARLAAEEAVKTKRVNELKAEIAMLEGKLVTPKAA
jgi:hypothetical protein